MPPVVKGIIVHLLQDVSPMGYPIPPLLMAKSYLWYDRWRDSGTQV